MHLHLQPFKVGLCHGIYVNPVSPPVSINRRRVCDETLEASRRRVWPPLLPSFFVVAVNRNVRRSMRQRTPSLSLSFNCVFLWVYRTETFDIEP